MLLSFTLPSTSRHISRSGGAATGTATVSADETVQTAAGMAATATGDVDAATAATAGKVARGAGTRSENDC